MAIVVAIDGPAGAGKSSVAANVARQAGLALVDTGAIYRTVTLQARRNGIPVDNGEALGKVASELGIRFRFADGKNRVFLVNGEGLEDVTEAIRDPDISANASKVSAHPQVRAALLELQRELGRVGEGAVLEGRDIGSVVFPDADVKVFLTASAKERARRRALELSDSGAAEPFDKVLRDIRARDKQDSEREVAPLTQPDDAELIDSSDLTSVEVVERILALIDTAKNGAAARASS